MMHGRKIHPSCHQKQPANPVARQGQRGYCSGGAGRPRKGLQLHAGGGPTLIGGKLHHHGPGFYRFRFFFGCFLVALSTLASLTVGSACWALQAS